MRRKGRDVDADRHAVRREEGRKKENDFTLLKPGSGWRLLTRAGVGLWHRLTLIVNGRLSLLWQPQPKWSLTALSGSLSGSVAGQELG